MQLGMLGLGRMGANMVRRLMRGGHDCVVHDHKAAAVAALVQEGATGGVTLREFAGKLTPPRAVWLMVPAGVVDTVIRDLLPLLEDPSLDHFAGRVSDSGEGRWTLQAAVDTGVPAPVLSAALFARFGSRGEADFANRLLSALRHEFGGHAEKEQAR